MKPGRGGGYGPFLLGENRLIAGFVNLFRVPPYIRRQSDFAVPPDFFFYVFALKPEYPITCFVFFNGLGEKIIREKKPCACLNPLFRLYHAVPEFRPFITPTPALPHKGGGSDKFIIPARRRNCFRPRN